MAQPFKVVVRVPDPPFTAIEGGEVRGFDIELVERFASWHEVRYGERLELEIGRVSSVNDLLDAAAGSGCDLAIGAITATLERAGRVGFSIPYLPVRLALFSRAGLFAKDAALDTLAGRKVGVVSGTVGSERLRELSDRVELTIVPYANSRDLADGLLGDQREIDAAIDDLTAYWALSLDRPVAMVRPIGATQGLAFVFAQGSTWRAKADEFLEEFTHTPGYFRLITKYFGGEASRMIAMSKGDD